MLGKNWKFLAPTALHEHSDQKISEVEEIDKGAQLHIDK